MTDDTLGRRILVARLELSIDLGSKISQETLGEWVARDLKRDHPITGASVSRWETDANAPNLETLAVIAATCRVDPGWLTFGRASRAPKRL